MEDPTFGGTQRTPLEHPTSFALEAPLLLWGTLAPSKPVALEARSMEAAADSFTTEADSFTTEAHSLTTGADSFTTEADGENSEVAW